MYAVVGINIFIQQNIEQVNNIYKVHFGIGQKAIKLINVLSLSLAVVAIVTQQFSSSLIYSLIVYNQVLNNSAEQGSQYLILCSLVPKYE
jgi:hypothetical protein